jgi:hypothetical protein
VDTTESSAPRTHLFTEDYDDTLEAHYSGLECLRSLREEKGMSRRRITVASGVFKSTLKVADLGKTCPQRSTACKVG